MTLKIINIRAKSGITAEGECVLIELSLNNGNQVWAYADQLPQAVSAIEVIEKKVAPLLKDQPIESFQNLIAEIDAVKQPVKTTRIIKPVPKPSAGTLSRRRLISGLLAEDKPESETIIEEQPLHPTLRFAISQTLFKAMAVSDNKTQLSLFLDVVERPLSAALVPLLVESNEANMALVQPIFSTVAAVGYSIGLANYKQMLGSHAERLQAYVRQMQDWLTGRVSDTRPAIHLNLQGAFSDLYENNEGKILGALSGLEQAARPFPLVVENVVKGEITAVSQTMKTLRSYLKTRQMSVALAGGYSLFAPEALKQLASETAVHQIHLAPAQFGSISQTLSFIQECKQLGIEVIVHGEDEDVETAVAIALATQSKSLSGPPDKLYNEMIKFTD